MAKSKPPCPVEVAIRMAIPKFEKYVGQNRLNEHDTKSALITPMLSALGWDTSDPEEVGHEYRHGPKYNPVDYVFKISGRVRFLVEAKALGETLSDHKWIAQTLGYAVTVGSAWCVLTDGDEYHIYNATAPVSAEEKLLCLVKLSADPPEAAASILKLLSRSGMADNSIEGMWSRQFVDRKVHAVLLGLFHGPDAALAKLVSSIDPGITPGQATESIRRHAVRIDLPPIGPPRPAVKVSQVSTPEQESGESGPVGVGKPKSGPTSIQRLHAFFAARGNAPATIKEMMAGASMGHASLREYIYHRHSEKFHQVPRPKSGPGLWRWTSLLEPGE